MRESFRAGAQEALVGGSSYVRGGFWGKQSPSKRAVVRSNMQRARRGGRFGARAARGSFGLTDAELASRLGDAQVLRGLGLDPALAERLAEFGGRAQALAEENSSLRAAVDESQPEDEGEQPAIRG
eukprot:SAG11_NODE_543_length_8635_cov_19.964633_2_plen_126_part_00